MNALRELISQHWPLPERGDTPVAWRGNTGIDEATFLADIARERKAISALNVPEIVLFEADVYLFAVKLLAAWSANCSVILADRAMGSVPTDKGRAASPESGPGTIFFTSGSSGTPQRVEKTCAQLLAEIQADQQAFGHLLPKKTRFVRSVPHYHMYGLPFSVLWPLTYGYAIVSEMVRHPDELWRLPQADYAFVSAPTFLKYLSFEDAQASGPAKWRMVTSAGSPLPADIHDFCSQRLEAPVFEIYGSTEAGAVARRTSGTMPWQAMPGVRLSVDADSSRLRIHSPLLPLELADVGFLSSDLARVGDEGLVLLGRVDRVVKIGEKRISLTQTEATLRALPEVRHAVVTLLHDRGRDALGAAVILNDIGIAQNQKLGKARFDRHLHSQLHDKLEPLGIPRRWRYVDALPTNDMGKTTQQALARLFAPQFPQAEFLAQDNQNNDKDAFETARLGLILQADLVWFEGHFPKLPVLPGVAQIDFAVHFGRLHFDISGAVTKMRGLKFQHLLHPNDAPILTLNWRAGKRELAFSYELADGTPCSRGVLVFQNTIMAFSS